MSLHRFIRGLLSITKADLFAYLVITIVLFYAIGFYLAYYHRVVSALLTH